MNPLFDPYPAPRFREMQAAHVEPGVEALLEQARASLDAIASLEDPTCENTALALDRATEPLDRAMSVIGHLEAVRTTPEFRAACNAVQPKTEEFYSSIPLNEKLWNVLQRVRSARAGVHARFLSSPMRGEFFSRCRRPCCRTTMR